eukprot:UN25472
MACPSCDAAFFGTTYCVCSDAEGAAAHADVQTKVLYESAVVTAPATCASQTWSRTCSYGNWGAWTSTDTTYDFHVNYAYSGSSIGGWESYSEAVTGCWSDPLCHGFYHVDGESYHYKGSCGSDQPTCCVGTGEELSNGRMQNFRPCVQFFSHLREE